jgi:hypothetical protein
MTHPELTPRPNSYYTPPCIAVKQKHNRLDFYPISVRKLLDLNQEERVHSPADAPKLTEGKHDVGTGDDLDSSDGGSGGRAGEDVGRDGARAGPERGVGRNVN